MDKTILESDVHKTDRDVAFPIMHCALLTEYGGRAVTEGGFYRERIYLQN
jgi:hypothetical protein